MTPSGRLSRRDVLGGVAGLGLAGLLGACERPLPRSAPRSRKRYFDVTTYGAVGDGTTDDTPALQAAVKAALAVSGTVYLPHGIYGLTSDLQLLGAGTSVTLVGEGQESSVIKALAPAAAISWGGAPNGPGAGGQTLFGRPSTSGSWSFDGNLIATRGVTVGSTVAYGIWRNIHVTKVRGDGWAVYPQNSIFTGCIGNGCAGNGWTLDYGIQACEFTGCHASGNDGWGFEIRQSGGLGWGGSAQPQGLRFVSGIVEQGGSPYFAKTGLGGVHIREGVDITFERFELVQGEGAGALVLTPSTPNGFVGRVVVRDCRVSKIYLNASVAGIAQTMGGTNEPLSLQGWNVVNSIVNGSTAQIYNDGRGPIRSYVPEGFGAATALSTGP